MVPARLRALGKALVRGRVPTRGKGFRPLSAEFLGDAEANRKFYGSSRGRTSVNSFVRTPTECANHSSLREDSDGLEPLLVPKSVLRLSMSGCARRGSSHRLRRGARASDCRRPCSRLEPGRRSSNCAPRIRRRAAVASRRERPPYARKSALLRHAAEPAGERYRLVKRSRCPESETLGLPARVQRRWLIRFIGPVTERSVWLRRRRDRDAVGTWTDR
jgi:hypothetical protein